MAQQDTKLVIAVVTLLGFLGLAHIKQQANRAEAKSDATMEFVKKSLRWDRIICVAGIVVSIITTVAVALLL